MAELNWQGRRVSCFAKIAAMASDGVEDINVYLC